MERIRKAVEEFKYENGNDNFSQKDLLMYIVKRIDNLPCEKHVQQIANVDARVRILLWAVPIIITLMGAITVLQFLL